MTDPITKDLIVQRIRVNAEVLTLSTHLMDRPDAVDRGVITEISHLLASTAEELERIAKSIEVLLHE